MVSRACKVMGLSRDTLYGYDAVVHQTGVEALGDSNRHQPNPKNLSDSAIEKAVIAYALEQPAYG
ncbi:MAG: helix-turn-helix domain-containing protein [Rhodobacteraceae bacterium]|nr:helix-turn-helix domain-containing protein [Paracoccaceae bacterium]